MANKVLVIGLDCGDFRFLKHFAKEGWLKNLGPIMEKGVTRNLKSTIPPVSPPAWATFLTGKNPGRHGIFQFVEMNIDDYSFTNNRLISSNLFSGATFIDFISEANRKVGLIKVPFTYPPWKVNGFMIAGEPSPDWTKAHTYPPGLSEKIGRVNLGSSADFIKYSPDELLRHLKFDCDVRTRIATEMMEGDDYDFFMLVHTITDAAVHRFWKYSDDTCPNYRKSFDKYKNLIREIYIEADKSIGRILEKTDPETTVFFMSDHGASRKPIHFFHINAYLQDRGLLRCRETESYTRKLMDAAAKVKYFLPPVMRHLIVHFLQTRLLGHFSALKVSAANFDWNQTQAYSVNLYGNYEGIVLNLKGRQPKGIVRAGSEAERLSDEIISDLLQIRDPRNGKKVVANVYRQKEVFEGPFARKMPDLIVQFHEAYRTGSKTSGSWFSDVPAGDFDFQSGDHHENGIFIACGTHIRKGLELQDAQIKDMAPTILYCMGLPVPDDLDGRVLLDIFTEDFVRQNPISRISWKQEGKPEEHELSEDDSAVMKEQLQGLGYM